VIAHLDGAALRLRLRGRRRVALLLSEHRRDRRKCRQQSESRSNENTAKPSNHVRLSSPNRNPLASSGVPKVSLRELSILNVFRDADVSNIFPPIAGLSAAFFGE
jgi:hypothetical protein